MSNNSKTALHNFLFHLRTPLSGINGVKAIIEKNVVLKDEFPPEAHAWLSKWGSSVDIWLKSAVDFTELYFAKDDDESHDWKALIQQLLSILEGVEIAAREAENIPHSNEHKPGDLLFMLINSINYVSDRWKETQELLPTLE
jgi:hypothetical protein